MVVTVVDAVALPEGVVKDGLILSIDIASKGLLPTIRASVFLALVFLKFNPWEHWFNGFLFLE